MLVTVIDYSLSSMITTCIYSELVYVAMLCLKDPQIGDDTIYLELLQMVRVVWLVGFYGISTFVGYLMPNPFLYE